MGSHKVTIQDLADELGLSKFSVSRALSGKSGVGPNTRNRVLRAAQAMGYQVPQGMTPAAGQLLFLRQEIDPVSSELWLNILHGAEREGGRLGLDIVPRQVDALTRTPMLDPAVVGLILAVPRPADWTAKLATLGLPIAAASYVPPAERIDQVVGADWESGFAVAEMLAGLGHRAMAFVHGSTTPIGRAERLRGFRDGARQAAPDSTVDDIVFDEAQGFRGALLDHLRQGRAPSALFCAHDGIAVSVLSELMRLGVQVPEDVSVVGFNDFAAATQFSPRLTTVRTPQVEMGAALVRCIADRVLGGRGTQPPVRLAFVAEIVRRETTGPARSTAWTQRVLAGQGA